MAYEGEQPLTPLELQARGLLPPGPLSPKMNPNTPTVNEQAIRDQAVKNVKKAIKPQPSGLEMMGQGAQMTGMGTQTPLGMFMNPTGKDVARAAVPAAAGMLLPQGRTLSRGLLQLGGNMLGSGAVELGSELMKPSEEQNKTGAFVKGNIEGILPGVISAAGGAIMGPNKATIQANKALGAFEKGRSSPNVKGIYDKENPAGLYSEENLRAAQGAAGANLDMMEDIVGKGLGQATFQVPAKYITQGNRNVNMAFPKTFQQIRDEIKELRNLGEGAYSRGPLAPAPEAVRAAKAQAHKLESELINEMRAQGFDAYADIYSAATKQYYTDKTGLRYIAEKRRERALPGGASPEDRPDLAKMEGILGGVTPSASHGAIGALDVATGRPIGALHHLGQFFDSLRGARGKVAESMPGRFSPSRMVGPLGGAAASYLEKPNFQSTEE